jgi:hypothetical protein
MLRATYTLWQFCFVAANALEAVPVMMMAKAGLGPTFSTYTLERGRNLEDGRVVLCELLHTVA